MGTLPRVYFSVLWSLAVPWALEYRCTKKTRAIVECGWEKPHRPRPIVTEMLTCLELKSTDSVCIQRPQTHCQRFHSSLFHHTQHR